MLLHALGGQEEEESGNLLQFSVHDTFAVLAVIVGHLKSVCRPFFPVEKQLQIVFTATSSYETSP